MTKRSAPTCFECRHFFLRFDVEPQCTAYTDGIPSAIYFGEIDHLTPLPGDNGIQWGQAMISLSRRRFFGWFVTRTDLVQRLPPF